MIEQLKLSICMIVKNEEKNLKRCLDSLLPLLSKPDVELIVVDTGSTDKTPDIALQYTPNVFFHTWNNNFSEMRNISISYAKGDRILTMDADEVLLNAEELYDLISDVSLQSYNTFMLKIKSYIGAGKDYTILPQERVYRNDGEFRFEGSIHNQPVFKSPILSTDICIDHYGYLSNDRELQERKFKRTGTILKQELEKNPNSIYYHYQLAKSYDAHGDHLDALREIRTAYGLMSEDSKNKIYIFGEYALIGVKLSEYEEVIKVCREGLDIEPEYLDLHYMQAESLQKLGRVQEAFTSYAAYIDLIGRYNKLKISSNRSVELLFMGDSFKDAALSFLINELIERNSYTEAKEYALIVKDERIREAFLFKIFLKLGEFKKLKALYAEKLDDRETLTVFETLTEEHKRLLGYEDRKKLELIFADGVGSYSLLNRIISAGTEDKESLIDELLKTADLNELPDFYNAMLENLVLKPKKLLLYMKQLKKTKIRSYANKIVESSYGTKKALEEMLINEPVRDNDYNRLRLNTILSFAILYNEAANIDKETMIVPEKYYSIFRAYLENGIKYIAFLYNTERLRLYYNTLEDQEDRFFIAISYARQAVEKGDYMSGIRYFGEAVRANPYMACYMKRYKEELFVDADDKRPTGNGEEIDE